MARATIHAERDSRRASMMNAFHDARAGTDLHTGMRGRHRHSAVRSRSPLSAMRPRVC